MDGQPRIIVGLNAVEESKQWVNLDDAVMGGLSRSQVVATDRNTAVFFGNVSLAHRGGFASVRAKLAAGSMRGTEGLRLRVRGDGRRYRLRLRTDGRLDGPTYEVSFKTEPNAWMEVRAPFERFTLTYRGRPLRRTSPLRPERIQQIGLMVADGQVGPFKLEIDWIAAFDVERDLTRTLLQMAEPTAAA